MDIVSGCGYPASALSNFAPHPFVFDGVECASMEGLLQAFKFDKEHIQVEVCKLVGREAKFRGKKRDWQTSQTLHWQGIKYMRDGQAYQELLDRAYDCLATNDSFRRALLATNDAVLKHSIGRCKKNETVLTRQEFCSRLMKLRDKLNFESRLMFARDKVDYYSKIGRFL